MFNATDERTSEPHKHAEDSLLLNLWGWYPGKIEPLIEERAWGLRSVRYAIIRHIHIFFTTSLSSQGNIRDCVQCDRTTYRDPIKASPLSDHPHAHVRDHHLPGK